MKFIKEKVFKQPSFFGSYTKLIDFIWQHMRLQKWVFVVILILDSFAWSLDSLLWPYILSKVIDIFIRFETSRLAVWSELLYPVIGALGLVLYVEIASRSMGFLMARAMPKLQADIRMHMFDHIQHHSPRYFNERFAGNLANKMTDMTTQIELILQQLFWPIIPAISTCILGAGFLWVIHPIFAWVLLGWTALHLCICILFAKSVDVYEHRHGESRSDLLGKIVDSFNNNFSVNLFFRFSFEKKGISFFQQIEKLNVMLRRCDVFFLSFTFLQ